jgi:hypothetical protein
MTRTHLDTTDEAYALLIEHGTPACDAVMYAIDEQERVEHETIMRALGATQGEVLAQFDAPGWNYLLHVEDGHVDVHRASKSATEHDTSEGFVESLFETYEVRLVRASKYEYIEA